MILYWSIFFILVVFSYQEIFSKGKFKFKKTHYYLVIGILLFLTTFKWERGSDWESYYTIFINGGVSSWDEHTEIGYIYLNKTIRAFTSSYNVYMLIQGALYYITFSHCILSVNKYFNKTYCANKIYLCTPLLFLFSQEFAGLFMARTALAYMLCFSAFVDLTFEKNKTFFIKVIIASFIHRSSFLFLVVYLMSKYFKFNKTYIALCIIFLTFLFSLSTYYEQYLVLLSMGDYSEYIRPSQSGNIIGLLKWFVILASAIMLHKEYNDKLYNVFLMTFAIGFMFYTWSQYFAPVAQRLAGLFINVVIFWLCYLFSAKRFNRKISFFTFVLFCALSLWSQLNGEYAKLFIPFKFVWESINVEVY